MVSRHGTAEHVFQDATDWTELAVELPCLAALLCNVNDSLADERLA